MADDSVQCRKCKSAVPRGARVCPSCGARLGASGASVQLPRPVVSPPGGTENAAPAARASTAGSAARLDPLIGRKLQEYVLEERIGVGGMGVVYRAVQPMIGKHVAVKVLRAEILSDPRDVDRLLEEARIVSRIKHRGIINIFGAGTLEDGRHYLIMELLEGESLEQRMVREGRIPAADAVIILERVLAALAAAHEVSIVHRDLKPANVFLASEAGKLYVKLLDFGLARPAQENVTRIAGTPDYISPEHARGRPAGPPADLYAFGVLCFHMLTGRLPYTGNTPLEVMEKHVHAPIPVLHDLEPSLPKALTELVLRLMAKEPADRPEAPQVLADLRAATRQLRAMPTMMSLEAVGPVVGAGSSVEEARRARELAVDAQLKDLKRKVGRTWPTIAFASAGLVLAGALSYLFWPSSISSAGGVDASHGGAAPSGEANGSAGAAAGDVSSPAAGAGHLPPGVAAATLGADAGPLMATAGAAASDDAGSTSGPALGAEVEAGVEVETADGGAESPGVQGEDGGGESLDDPRAPLDDFQLGELKREKRFEERLVNLELAIQADPKKRVRFENEFRVVKAGCDAAVSRADVLKADDDLTYLERAAY